MPENRFLELETEKRMRIIQAGIDEFSEYGYYNSSTNRIVKNAGISKGSLFQYFINKEEYFIYIIDCVIRDFLNDMQNGMRTLPQDPFERIISYSEMEASWYISNYPKYNLIKCTIMDDSTELSQTIKQKYDLTGVQITEQIFSGADADHLKWGKQKSLNTILWFLKGFNEDFMKDVLREDADLDQLKLKYVSSLKSYMEVLKSGLLPR